MAKKNIFVGVVKLHDVRGRISYTNNKKKQELVLGIYDTHTDTDTYQKHYRFWSALAEDGQKRFRQSGNLGRTYAAKDGTVKEYKCCEARELIIEIPNEFYTKFDMDMKQLAKVLATAFKNAYGVECNLAVHWNETKTNLHAHLIYSERQMLKETAEPYIAQRNLFFNEHGVKVRTKKEILDASGELREGCYIVPKGSEVSQVRFSDKNAVFKSYAFTNAIKREYASIWNQTLQEDKYQVFNKNDIYLAQKKIKKSYKPAMKKRITEENQAIVKFNHLVSELYDLNYDKEKLMDMKKAILEDTKGSTIDLPPSDYHRYFMLGINAINNIFSREAEDLRKERLEKKPSLTDQMNGADKIKEKNSNERSNKNEKIRGITKGSRDEEVR